MVKEETSQRFGCIYCGKSFEAFPPDNYHYVASRKEKDVDDPIEMKYNCDNCHKDNILYWGQQKLYAVRG
jgi:DNA-directed RNA polymerase subunit M/transcription elongation factor TFIIS